MYYKGSWATEPSPLGEGHFFHSLASEYVGIFYDYLKFSYIYITYLDHIHPSLTLTLTLPRPPYHISLPTSCPPNFYSFIYSTY